jgi:hypothetical protein
VILLGGLEMAVAAGQVVRAHDVAVQACRVTRSSALSVPSSSSLLTVPFNVEEFDTDGMHDNSTFPSRITIQTAGIYMVGFNGVMEASNLYQRTFCNLLLNGTLEIARNQTPGTASTLSSPLQVITCYQFDEGDYIEVQVSQIQSSGSLARNLENTADRSPEFWAARIGS